MFFGLWAVRMTEYEMKIEGLLAACDKRQLAVMLLKARAEQANLEQRLARYERGARIREKKALEDSVRRNGDLNGTDLLSADLREAGIRWSTFSDCADYSGGDLPSGGEGE